MLSCGGSALTMDLLYQYVMTYHGQKYVLEQPACKRCIDRLFTTHEIRGKPYHVYGDICNARLVILYFNGSAFLPTRPKREFINYILLRRYIRVPIAVVSLETREYKFPTTIRDYLTLYRLIHKKHGIPYRRIILAGVSSGGMLAMASIIHLIRTNAPLPRGCILISPCVGCDHTIPPNQYDIQPASRKFYSEIIMRNIARYCGDTDKGSNDPMLNPYRYDFKKWIPTILFHATTDGIVSPEIRRVIRRLKRNGDHTIIRKKNVIHAWVSVTWYRWETHQALQEISQWVDRTMNHTTGK